MTTRRKQHTAQFKFKVALEAAKGEQTRNQIASKHGVHPGQVTEWKQKLLTEGVQLFGRQPARDAAAQAARETELYEQIGRIKAWLMPPRPRSILANNSPHQHHLSFPFCGLDNGGKYKKSVIRIFRITATDGKKHLTNFYNLDAIISVGYRVNSHQAGIRPSNAVPYLGHAGIARLYCEGVCVG